MSAPVEVLLVRGAPGVGKSSAMRHVRRALPGGAIIEVDDLRRMIAGVKWVDREHHQLGLEHARLLIESFLAKGFAPVVVVDTFSRRLADPFAKSLGREYRIASLIADPAALLGRIDGRPLDQFRDRDASMKLDDETRRDRFEHDELIDTTNLDAEAVAARIVALLGSAP